MAKIGIICAPGALTSGMVALLAARLAERNIDIVVIDPADLHKGGKVNPYEDDFSLPPGIEKLADMFDQAEKDRVVERLSQLAMRKEENFQPQNSSHGHPQGRPFHQPGARSGNRSGFSPKNQASRGRHNAHGHPPMKVRTKSHGHRGPKRR